MLTGEIVRSITVLIVICPYALVLATPTALVAAIGNTARRGVLVKNGAVMGAAGTAVAMETASIVLLADEIDRVPYLIEISRSALGTIRNNVIFSMTWNVLSVILSGLGAIGPVFGAVMHELSALPVMANSSRLIAWKQRQ